MGKSSEIFERFTTRLTPGPLATYGAFEAKFHQLIKALIRIAKYCAEEAVEIFFIERQCQESIKLNITQVVYIVLES